MNNKRRKKIQALIERLSIISDEVDCVRGEEQECFDNIPESLQESERASMSENAVDALETALNSLSEVIDNLEEAAS